MSSRFLLTMLFAGSALPMALVQAAQNGDFVPFWYAGISVAHNVDEETKGGGNSHNGLNAIIDGLHLGYQFNPYVMTAVEFQYLGNIATNQGWDDFQQGVVSVKLGYPITDQIMPYLKAGGAGWFLNDGYDYGFTGIAGAGMQYQAMDNVALNVEYQYTNSMGNDVIGYFDHQRISLGLSWRFAYEKPRIVTVEKIIEVEKIVEIESKPQFEHVVITNVQAALFKNNSSVLENVGSLTSVVDTLVVNPELKVVISGYTDSIGRSSYNQWLSERRAERVAMHLVSKGIKKSRVSFFGYGELAPVATNNTVDGRALNRRVVIGFE
jgi:OOP family OmpA-OmpF porin